MTVRAEGPGGERWSIRRGVVRGSEGRVCRWGWRGPDPGWLEPLRVADFADIRVLGVVVLAIVIPIVVAVVLVFRPLVAIGVVEALVLGVVGTVLLAAATLFGRPVIARAEREDAAGRGAMTTWAVTGWAQSRAVRDRVTRALQTGADRSPPPDPAPP